MYKLCKFKWRCYIILCLTKTVNGGKYNLTNMKTLYSLFKV